MGSEEDGSVTMGSVKALLKTSLQELQEVVEAKKPAALGYWETLPDKVLSQRLLAVYGRYYDMAIAMTEENLIKVVRAYYMPLSRKGDIALGRALGYEDKDIIEYVSKQAYPKFIEVTQAQRTEMKVIATIQKVGLEKAIEEIYSYYDGGNLAKHVVEKENVDINLAFKFIMKIKRGEKRCYLARY